MRIVLAIFLSLVCLSASAATPAEEVRAAELAFSKKFEQRDFDGFFAMVADDAVFNDRFRSMIGRKAVMEGWGPLLKSPKPSMTWGPDRTVVNGDGTLGLSYGPIYDYETGRHAGYYSSVWQKQKDGSWKVLFDGPGSPPSDLGVKVEEGFVTTEDGAKLFYRKAGQGGITLIAPLDFVLHADLKQFADLGTIITYDPRNRGRSSRVENVKTLTIDQDVKDLEALRAHLKVDKFVPVGFSYLGKMVLMYAMQYPQHVSRVVQLGPAAMGVQQMPPPNFAELGIPAEASKRWNDLRAAGADTKSPREYCEAQWEALRYLFIGNPKYASRFDVKSACAHENEWPVNLHRHIDNHKFGLDLALSAGEVKKVTAPVLIVHGTKDRNAPFDGAVEWRKTLPNARLMRIEGAAHKSWADDPVLVWGTVRQFLRGEVPLATE